MYPVPLHSRKCFHLAIKQSLTHIIMDGHKRHQQDEHVIIYPIKIENDYYVGKEVVIQIIKNDMYYHRFTCKLRYINILRLSTFYLSPFSLNIEALAFEWIPSIIDMHLNKSFRSSFKLTNCRFLMLVFHIY